MTLKSAKDRLAENIISPQRPAQTALDQVHTAIAITDRHDSAAAQVGSRHYLRVGIRFPNAHQSRLSAKARTQTQDQEACQSKRSRHSRT